MFIYISGLLSLSLSHCCASIIIFGIWRTKESLFEGLPPSWCVGFQRRGICERQVWKNKSGWTWNSFLKYVLDIGWNISNIIHHQVKDGRGLRKFIKETLHATAGEAQPHNHTQILSIWFLPDSKDVIIYKKCLYNLTFQEKFLTTCLAALKFPWRTFQPAGYVLSAKLTYFFDARQLFSCQ